MALDFSNLRCQLSSDVDSALAAYQDQLGLQFLAIKAMVERTEALGESLHGDFSYPMRSSMDSLLSNFGSSTQVLGDAILSIPSGGSEDVEFAIKDRFNIFMVNGRMIHSGDRDLSCFQSMARLLGGISGILAALPELGDLVPFEDSDSREFVPHASISVPFILVCSYIKKTVTPATFCTPEVVVQEEVTLGVDLPLSVCAGSVGISVDDLRVYIFWTGVPSASPGARRKALSLGLTNSQFVRAVSKRTSQNFFVYLMEDPADLARVIDVFGDDADDVLRRVSGGINLYPSVDEISSGLRAAARSASPGSSGPTGQKDFFSPSLSLANCLDLNKTFDLDGEVARVTSRLSTTDVEVDVNFKAFVEGLAQTIKSKTLVLTSALSLVQGKAFQYMNDITELVTLVNGLLDTSSGKGAMANCVMGVGSSAFGSVGLADLVPADAVSAALTSRGLDLGAPGTSGVAGFTTDAPVDSILSLLESHTNNIELFLGSLGDLFGSLSDMSCNGSFVTTAFGSDPTWGGYVECLDTRNSQLGIPRTPFADSKDQAQIDNFLSSIKLAFDTITWLFDKVRSTLRQLRVTLRIASRSLRAASERRSVYDSIASSFSSPSYPEWQSAAPGCANAATTELQIALVQRSLASVGEVGEV